MFALGRIAARPVRSFSSTSRVAMAKINIIGHLAAPPSLEATSTGQDIIKYAVASNSGPRENRKTSWFNIASFTEEGPKRDFLLALEKGTLVYVEGEVRMNTYEDRETGKSRQAMSISQRQIEVLKRPNAIEE